MIPRPMNAKNCDTKDKIVFVLKGYPRLSETFIAQEILGLERAGLNIHIVALRRPTDTYTHPVHQDIRATVEYLPEYLHNAPMRVVRGLGHACLKAGFWSALAALLADLPRDLSRNRLRRFGQALVLVREVPESTRQIHAHFIHTPASVCRYASLISGIPWSCSAHAKDIWTTPEQDLRDKLQSADWAVTCTKSGQTELNRHSPPEKPVYLQYHGFDRQRFPPLMLPKQARTGLDAALPVRLLSVGRAVEKKGLDLLLEALSRLPAELFWTLTHIGGGERLPDLKSQANRLGLSDRITFLGAQAQERVLEEYRQADLFVLPCRVAGDGDRDGLPNVIVEAQSQSLPVLSTFVSAIPELVENERTGLLVEPNDIEALNLALQRMIRDPALRQRLGKAGALRVHQDMGYEEGISALMTLFRPIIETAESGPEQHEVKAAK